MMRFNFGLGWFSRMKLQRKLILGFIFLSLLIGASGGSGLFFVNKISNAVGIFSDVSSPLVDETTALVENMQKMHIAMLEALAQTDADNDRRHATELTDLDATTQQALGRLVVSDSWWKLVFGVAPDHDGCSIRRRGQSAS